jgi:hypothetical protein
MSEGTEHHLEHAQHTQHAAHNPFDRGVAMTMAIIAAILAGVTLVSHRGHTETLRLATDATTHHTKASDERNLYQAKNIRNHEYQMFLFLQAMLAKDVVKQDDESKAMRQFWVKQVDKFEGEGYWNSVMENLGNPKDGVKKTGLAAKDHGEEKKSTEGEGASKAERALLSDKATALQSRAKSLEEQSHHLHERVTWIDLGHLGLELALVFCAVAVLTKQRSFLLTGIAFAVAGSGLAVWGMAGWWMMGGDPGAVHH